MQSGVHARLLPQVLMLEPKGVNGQASTAAHVRRWSVQEFEDGSGGKHLNLMSSTPSRGRSPMPSGRVVRLLQKASCRRSKLHSRAAQSCECRSLNSYTLPELKANA